MPTSVSGRGFPDCEILKICEPSTLRLWDVRWWMMRCEADKARMEKFRESKLVKRNGWLSVAETPPQNMRCTDLPVLNGAWLTVMSTINGSTGFFSAEKQSSPVTSPDEPAVSFYASCIGDTDISQ